MVDNRFLKPLGLLVAAIAIVLGLNQTGLWSPAWLRSNPFKNLSAESSSPQIFVFSEDPVVVYVKDFVNAQEAAHLVQIA